jgi:hypothetical protein
VNRERRKEIAQALAMIEEAKTVLETCRDDEQDYFDNMPESFQSGEKGELAQTAIDLLEEVISGIEGLTPLLEEFSA